jgi:hypothetical protein
MTSNVLPFRRKTVTAHDDAEDADVDLLTAVDVVIRELRDMSRGNVADRPVRIAECLTLLERAYRDTAIPS